MAPVYRLKYFSYMGLVEPIRYLFAYGNIPYENVVVPEAEWAKMQKVVPFGTLPVLEVDNRTIWHSVAISQYLAKIVGLWSTDEFEVAEQNATAQVVYELGFRFVNYHLETRREFKPVILKELEEVYFPRYLTDLEEIVTKKTGPFFGGKQPSWVDFYFVGIMEWIELVMGRSVLQSQYPVLYKLWVEVRNVPAIKSYIAKRPAYRL